MSDYTSYEARLLHMFLALYSSSMAFEFTLNKNIKLISDQRKVFKNKANCVLFAFVFFKLKFAICVVVCFVIRELAKNKEERGLENVLITLHCGNGENACNNKNAQL